jgi:ABC-type sugar transport system permease subunit
MKRLAIILLFLVGLVEVVVGLLVARLRISLYALPFFTDLSVPKERAVTFNHYISLFQDQWHLVSWFGIITILSTGLLVWLESRGSSNKINTEGDR